jgi:hypothetical protein
VKLRESRSQSSWAPVVDLFGEPETRPIRKFADLRSELSGLGIDAQWLSELHKAIKKDGDVDGIGPAVAVWLSGLITAVATNELDVELNVATLDIPQLIKAYLNSGQRIDSH